MRPIVRFLTTLYVTLTLTAVAPAQVTFDLNVGSLAATQTSSPTFFVGTSAGLFSGEGDLTQLRPVYITPAGTAQPRINQVLIDGSNIYVRSVTPARTIWTSRDGGQTWAETIAGLPSDHDLIELYLVTGGKLMAVMNKSATTKLYVSTDAGASWTFQSDFPTNTEEISVNHNMPDLIFATAGGLVWRTTNGGQDWSSVSTQPFNFPQDQSAAFIYSSAKNPANVVIGGGGAYTIGSPPYGIYHSDDQGASWDRAINVNAVRLVAGHDWPYYFHLRSAALGAIDVSFDEGRTWQPDVQFAENRNHDMVAALPDPRNNQIVYIGAAGRSTESKLYRSANQGIDWVQVNSTVLPTIGGPTEPLTIELPRGAPARASRLNVRTVESSDWELDYTVDEPGVGWLAVGSTGGTTGDEGIPVTVDPAGLEEGEYIADVTIRSEQSNNKQVVARIILQVKPELTGPQPRISTIGGDGGVGPEGYDGPALEAELVLTSDIAIGPEGSIYLAGWIQDFIDRITPDGTYQRFAGTDEEGFAGDGGPALQAQFDGPDSVAAAPDGSLYVADEGNRRVRKIDPQGVVTTVAGNGESFSPQPDAAGQDATAVSIRPGPVAVDSEGLLYVTNFRDLYRLTPSGAYSRLAESIPGGFANGIFVGPDRSVYVAGDDSVRRIRRGGAISIVAGMGAAGYTGDGGLATQATLDNPGDVAIGEDGTIYIADTNNHAIRAIDNAGVIRTIAGNGASGFSGDGGPALFAQLSRPSALLYRDGRLYINDAGNRRIRVIDFNTSGENPQFSQAGVVNAGSFAINHVSPGENISVFGSAMANETAIATSTPLPETLAGVRVTITDSAGSTQLCRLFFVTITQINCNVPDETALGQATMTISTPAGSSSSPISVNATAPGLFAANATGEGVSASIAIRIAADGTQSVVDVIDTSQQPFVEKPIDLGPEGEQVVLLLYGTGIRNWQTIEVTIGGQAAQVIGVAPQGEFVGLDQVNVLIPRSLIGAGVVEIRMTVDGQTTNIVTMRIQ